MHEPLSLIAVVAEFALGVFVLYVLPRLILYIRELHEARSELTVLALAEERVRVARDLHDTLGQLLSVALLKIDLAERVGSGDASRLRRELGEIQALLRESMAEMQRVVLSLRQPSLRAEITSAAVLLRSTGAEVTVSVTDVVLSARTSEVLAWVVREGATNILRHSTATHCAISLDGTRDRVRLSLVNNVPTPSTAVLCGGNGLPGLRERLGDVDGDLSVSSTARGFTLTASVPPATAG